jgi:multicomponent Na+:H+ antiporter subunit G
MSSVLDLIGALLVLAGTAFSVLATLGLLRFPDPMSRLHALTKADGTGLGLCVAGLALIALDLGAATLMLLIWCGVMLSGATAAHLVARRILERQENPDGG